MLFITLADSHAAKGARMNAQEYQQAQIMLRQIKTHFSRKCKRLDLYGDCARLRFDNRLDILVQYDHTIVAPYNALNDFQRAVLNELKYFIAHEEVWYTDADVARYYPTYDLVIVRVPDHFYPDYLPYDQSQQFDENRPYQRLIGSSRKAKIVVNTLRQSGSDTISVKGMNFSVPTRMIRDYVHMLGLQTFVIANPPFDLPIDTLSYRHPDMLPLLPFGHEEVACPAPQPLSPGSRRSCSLSP